MAENKTQENDGSVVDFLDGVVDEKKRSDSFVILDLMKRVSGVEPKMWGSSIVGFGKQHYKYASGREGDWFWIGFSPRKQDLTLYLTIGYDQHEDLLNALGKHRKGVGCLYIKKIADVDLAVLEELISRSVAPHLSAG